MSEINLNAVIAGAEQSLRQAEYSCARNDRVTLACSDLRILIEAAKTNDQRAWVARARADDDGMV